MVSRERLTAAAGLGAGTFAAFFVTALGSILLTRHGGVTAPFWPSNALALVLLLRRSKGPTSDAAGLAGVLTAGWAANALGGSPPALALGFGLLNVVEIALAATLARRFAPLKFPTVASGWKFLGVVGIAPPLVAALGCRLLTGLTQPASADAAASTWAVADFMGFLLVGPFGMTVTLKGLRKLELGRRWREAVAVAALVAAATLVAFGQSSFPLLFVVCPALLVATFRFRLIGANAAALLVALIAAPLTEAGHGPMALVHVAGPGGKLLMLQLFIAVACLTALPVASALGERDLYARRAEADRLRAEAANTAKSRLLSYVSHEIRSPLTGILGFGSLIEAGLLSPAQIMDFAGRIREAGETLKALTDDLLDMARAEAGVLAVHPETVEVGESVRRVLADVAGLAERLGVEVQVGDSDATLAVVADPLRYRQVLTNLATNAIKYGAGHGPVRIGVRGEADGFVRVSVSNGGPGIAPAQQGGLFAAFDRLGAENSSIEGVGLGLTLAKELVELQQGRIAFESRPGEQTRFWVDLPMAA